MKTRCLLIFMLMSAYFTLAANPNLGGFWNNYDHNITLEIRETYDGFKAKRTDKREWYYYKRQSPKRFADKEGNAYVIDDQNTLIWQDYYGKKNLHFYRRDIEQNQYANRGRVERFDRSAYDTYSLIDALRGRWNHAPSSGTMTIYRRNLNLRVETRRGTSIYRPIEENIFVDKRGNTITLISPNKLEHFYKGNVLILERSRRRW